MKPEEIKKRETFQPGNLVVLPDDSRGRIKAIHDDGIAEVVSWNCDLQVPTTHMLALWRLVKVLEDG